MAVLMSVILNLNCGCLKRALNVPRDWDTELCKYHGWQDVVAFKRSIWHSICRQPGCDYRRTHGMSRKYADTAATQHHLRTGHRVVIQFYGGADPKGVEIQSALDIAPQPQLPLDMPPPF